MQEVTDQVEATTVEPKAEEVKAEVPQQEAKKPNPLQSRIDELTRARHEAEREAQYWRTVAETEKQREAEAKPVKADFADDDTYVEALAEWKAKKAVAEAMSQSEARRAESVQQAAQQARGNTFVERVAEFKKTATDYGEVMEAAADIKVTAAMRDAILESEYGPQIGYHLAKNPKEADRIAQMEPLAAARAIGRLEAALESGKQSIKTTNAPEPASTLRGTGGKFVKDESAMSDKEWFASKRKRV